jgi:hypothetical protein
MFRRTTAPIVSAAVAVLLVGAAATPARAVAIPAQSLIQIRQIENPTPGVLYNYVTTAGTFSNTATSDFGSDIQATGSLAGGETGTRYSATSTDAGNGQSLVNMFDTLSFTTPGNVPTTVSYQAALDGFLSNTGTNAFDGASASLNVKIYDITGLSTWLERNDSTSDPHIFTNAGLVSELAIQFVLGTQDLVDAYAAFSDASIVDTSGVVSAFNLTKSASFAADPTKTYGIQIFTESSGIGTAAADFLNTGTFQFSNLNGADFSSASGVFLSDVSTTVTVPEPASIALFGFGLAGLMTVRRSTMEK